MLEKILDQQEKLKLTRKLDEDRIIERIKNMESWFEKLHKKDEKEIDKLDEKFQQLQEEINELNDKNDEQTNNETEDEKLRSEIYKNIKVKQNIVQKLQKERDLFKDDLKQINDGLETFKEIIHDRRSNIVNDYINEHKEDLDDMIQAIYRQFKTLAYSDFDTVSLNNPNSFGALKLIKICRKKIQEVEKANKAIELHKDDIRYEIFKNIFDILNDDIRLRKKVLELHEQYLKQAHFKIEEGLEYTDNDPI